MIANRGVRGAWETFTPVLLDSGSGYFAIKTYHGTYLSAPGGNGWLTQVSISGTSFGNDQKFVFLMGEGNIIGFKTAFGNKHCSVQSDNNKVICDRDWFGAWEKFTPQ
jgi:hypothetical protein